MATGAGNNNKITNVVAVGVDKELEILATGVKEEGALGEVIATEVEAVVDVVQSFKGQVKGVYQQGIDQICSTTSLWLKIRGETLQISCFLALDPDHLDGLPARLQVFF